jgi:hypothetical protein
MFRGVSLLFVILCRESVKGKKDFFIRIRFYSRDSSQGYRGQIKQTRKGFFAFEKENGILQNTLQTPFF